MALDEELLRAALPRYEIGEEIGRGGWGIVLRGRHLQLGRDVAIKQLPRAFGADPAVRDRFIDEARVVARLDHPHIVPVFDFVEYEGLCVIVMELASGGTLWDRFRKQGLETDEAVGTVLAAAVGLHHAHVQGVLHRDVKPENVLFSSSGTAKIADFGIAKTMGHATAARTATGSVVGTPAYMAPEQVTGDELSAATDVYALAVVLYELLTGVLPYRPVTEPVAQLFQHVNDDPRPMSAVREGVPAELEAVVRRALSKAPGDRPGSAEEFAVELAIAATSALGSGWLARSGVPVMSATSVVAATERGPAPEQGSRRAGTVLVKAGQVHPRLGAVASSGGPQRTPPPSSPPPPVPPPAPPSPRPPPPPPPSGEASRPPVPAAAGPAAAPRSAALSPGRRVGVLVGLVALVAAVAVALVVLVDGGGGGGGAARSSTSAPGPTLAADEITAAEVATFRELCSGSGVTPARCGCAIDRALDQLTALEFRANLDLMAADGKVSDPVAEVFRSCVDDGI